MRPSPAVSKKEKKGVTSSAFFIVLCIFLIFAFTASYSLIKSLLSPTSEATQSLSSIKNEVEAVVEEEDPKSYCTGMDSIELWGETVKWGTENRVDSAAGCCQQCKDKCTAAACECNSWVYCGSEEKCGAQYKQCWLKRQADVLFPEIRSTDTPWTSGIIHPEGKGIICLKTDSYCIRLKLEPSWAPLTVHYIRQVLRLRHCTGCQFYRAEQYNGADLTLPGAPQALLQGTLQTEGILYKAIPQESMPLVKKGYVCLIQGGPDFFISLADHFEWGHSHTVFAQVLPEDMPIVEKITSEPTRSERWGEDLEVRVLAKPVDFVVTRA